MALRQRLRRLIPSPLVYTGVLYIIKSGGILTAFDPATGEVFKSGRVSSGG